MYHPYFRGKQFELIAIRETASLLAKNRFTPIIEPVQGSLSGLNKALEEVVQAQGTAIVIVNPVHGSHQGDGQKISAMLAESFNEEAGISAGILLSEGMRLSDAMGIYRQHQNLRPVFIHAGFSEGKDLAVALDDELASTCHVFNETNCGKLYRKHFLGGRRILLRDGFKRRKNADHPPVEDFSDLHVTYREEGMDGFGDHLIVGDQFSEGGGPAYAVAIHLTFIDPENDDVMSVYHSVSDDKDAPNDTAKKFRQAVVKLVNKLDAGDSNIFEGQAISQFRALHASEHFPGLGSVKKFSMIHRIETMADYLK